MLEKTLGGEPIKELAAPPMKKRKPSTKAELQKEGTPDK